MSKIYWGFIDVLIGIAVGAYALLQTLFRAIFGVFYAFKRLRYAHHRIDKIEEKLESIEKKIDNLLLMMLGKNASSV